MELLMVPYAACRFCRGPNRRRSPNLSLIVECECVCAVFCADEILSVGGGGGGASPSARRAETRSRRR
ncbi:hypothetical protein ANCDUO_24418 [Ancylostoma duodenale]|uniref:Uncharacterized protein n=1 Tax=Ancylostoma duodenale TaxID=51022 RepID=A0A0C2FL02_9BILA|nr:hypothetical protein ANCDUO_24418 [Ancylostoma duodenale]